ncbi:helix-turn-helix domain-containing protein [Streptomyces sp. NPDC059917]|uniref:helix-turn-helix domain-containing protein n=1 Tax=Streptomyces sp. NPDC059917 TaxID=3347002 RepID=UPI0036562DDA
MSSASVSALSSKEPSQVRMSTLIASCTVMDCTPNDLFEVDTTPVERPAAPTRPVADLSKAVSARGPFDSSSVNWRERHRGRQTGRLHRLRSTVGFINRRYCCRCTARQKEAAARAACPPVRPAARPPGGHRPVHHLLTRMIHALAAAGPDICGRTPAGAGTARVPGRTNSRPGPVSNAAEYGSTQGSDCARPAGSVIPIVPSSGPNISLSNSTIRPTGCRTSRRISPASTPLAGPTR